MDGYYVSLSTEVENHPEKKVWGLWATVGFGLVVIAISIIVQMLVGIVLILINMFSYFNTSLGTPQFEEVLDAVLVELSANLGLFITLATCVSAVICVGLIIIIVKVRRSISIAEYLGFRQITARTILVAPAITVGFIILSGLIGTLLERPVSGFMLDAYNTSVWPVLFWIAVIIFAPAFEEIFFRGFLFEGFRQSRIGSIGAIGLTALVWAVFHVQYDTYGIVTIFILGIVLGVVRLKTNSLWSTLIIHAFFNLIAMLEIVLYLNGFIS